MTVCKKCGFQNQDASAYCTNCGSALEKTPVASAPTAVSSSPSASGRAVAALILGICSIVMSCGPFTGIVAIVLANQELHAIREGGAPESGKTMSQIGLWTGWIGTVACTLFWVAYAVFIFVMVGSVGGWR